MRNRIEKSNKTKFDYVARTLGVFGILIIAVTAIVGGTTLASVSNENKNLINMIEMTQQEETRIQNAKNGSVINTEEVEIIIEEQ